MENTQTSNDMLMKFYSKNLSQLDDMWYDFCFMEARFETPRESRNHYHNEDAFWEFVEDIFNKELL